MLRIVFNDKIVKISKAKISSSNGSKPRVEIPWQRDACNQVIQVYHGFVIL